MKRFIYYDSNGINSYLAQIRKGLTTNITGEQQQTEETSNTQEKGKNVISDIGAKVMGIGAEIREDVRSNNIDSGSTSNLVKEVEEKVLHDFAFETVSEYFKENSMIKNSNYKIGDIVHLNENITFFDFDYFEKIFSEKGVYQFSIKESKKQITQIRESIPKGSKLPLELKQEIDKIEKDIKEKENDRKSTLEIIEMAKNTLPYVRFVMSEDCILVLNDNYFRDDPNNVAFKYGGNIETIGYITNIISSESKIETVNAFSEVYKFVNLVLLSLYSGKTDVYVVHPLAIYF